MIHGHQVAFFLRELTSPDPARRAAAVKGLGHVPGHVPELAAATDDGSPEVRAAAALGLGRQGAADQGGRLVALCADPDAEVRRRAVNALVRIGATGPAVAEAFVRRVGDTELRNRAAVLGWLLRFEVPVPAESLMPKGDPVLDEMAHRAAHRLVRMLTGDAENAAAYQGALWNIPEVRPLLPALLDDPQGKVRSVALYLAEHFGDVDFAVRLRLLDDPCPSVRHGAAMTFERLAEQRRLTPAEQDELRPRLEHAREDPDDLIRLYAARTLVHLAPSKC
ncbi:HEAT repeat domain-containing protein [Actinomadura bangladeshensis]|uniref:HEAT repeat domain-containing protein n=1 Tax=Actinomadura bangladeshensis TaxID=453573 RepID=A0A4R4P5J4_9ACTN|nr:HEAT repeat domain-containing protein [Actinomadura bangladeshensis]TDC15342.1 hypothetical protein E1284_15615 [Actinomadura bangladeshensis]